MKSDFLHQPILARFQCLILFAIGGGVFAQSLPTVDTQDTTHLKLLLQEEAVSRNVKRKHEPGLMIDVEVSPRFPGGEEALYRFIDTVRIYPPQAIEEQIEGRVVVRFIITDTGELKNVEVFRSLCPSCDAEALRIVKRMPKWIPGRWAETPKAMNYVLPIPFRLPLELKRKLRRL